MTKNSIHSQMLPANAGMTPTSTTFRPEANCVPRECGGDPGTFFPWQLLKRVLPANAGVIP